LVPAWMKQAGSGIGAGTPPPVGQQSGEQRKDRSAPTQEDTGRYDYPPRDRRDNSSRDRKRVENTPQPSSRHEYGIKPGQGDRRGPVEYDRPGAPGTWRDPDKVPRKVGDWQEVYDSNSKKWYWWNAIKHKSRWSLPREDYDKLPPKDTLPKGWSEQYDSSSKKKYYWNSLTETASWKKPEADDDSIAKEKLPEGWTEEYDVKEKRIYYWNTKDKTASWVFPGLGKRGDRGVSGERDSKRAK